MVRLSKVILGEPYDLAEELERAGPKITGESGSRAAAALLARLRARRSLFHPLFISPRNLPPLFLYFFRNSLLITTFLILDVMRKSLWSFLVRLERNSVFLFLSYFDQSSFLFFLSSFLFYSCGKVNILQFEP